MEKKDITKPLIQKDAKPEKSKSKIGSGVKNLDGSNAQKKGKGKDGESVKNQGEGSFKKKGSHWDGKDSEKESKRLEEYNNDAKDKETKQKVRE